MKHSYTGKQSFHPQQMLRVDVTDILGNTEIDECTNISTFAALNFVTAIVFSAIINIVPIEIKLINNIEQRMH